MKEFPYEVMIHKSNHLPAEAWCRERFGPRWSVTENRNGSWCCFWGGRERLDHFRYYFANDRDMVMFLLRWT